MEPEEYDRLDALEDTHWRFVALRAVLRRALEMHATPGPSGALRILDAGCGAGGTARDLSALGPMAAVDLSPRALHFAAARGLRALARASVEALPFANASFDAVVSVDVLYHRAVRDDAAALRELGRVCRPGGLVALWLPAYEWLRSAHDAAVHTERRYTRRRMIALAHQADLVPERVSYAHALLLPPAIAFRALFRRGAAPRSDLGTMPGWLGAALVALLRAEGALALRARLPFGLSVLALLRKP